MEDRNGFATHEEHTSTKSDAWIKLKHWISYNVPEWRRCLFLSLMVLCFSVFGIIAVQYGVQCYVGSVPEKEAEVIRQSRGPCFLATQDGGALTIIMAGVASLFLGLLCVLGTFIIWHNQFHISERKSENESLKDSRDSLEWDAKVDV